MLPSPRASGRLLPGPTVRRSAPAVRRTVDVGAAAVDVATVLACLVAALLLRYDGHVPATAWPGAARFGAVAAVLLVGAFWAHGLYAALWRHASGAEALRVVRAELTWCAAAVLVLVAWHRYVPVSVPVVAAALHTLVTGGGRFRDRFAAPAAPVSADTSRVVIVGAGDAGAALLRAIRREADGGLTPVAVLDDDPRKLGRRLSGVAVLGPVDSLAEVAAQVHADEVLLAIPSASQDVVRRVSDQAERAHLPLRLLPPLRELVHGRVSLADVREVSIDDLLGRQQVSTDLDAVARLIRGRRVLVTGAGGSIGAEIARQVARLEPAELLLLDHDETHLYDVFTTLGHPAVQILADIRQRGIVNQLFARHRPQVVFHAAAHKHVPLLEDHPCEAVKTNVSGTDNLVAAASTMGVERFVFISTDKAVRPSSVMGATKRLGEHIVLSAPPAGGIFCAVRFGNVLGSRGSVVPTFIRQIRAGGPVTVTDPRMTRFFMSIPEAVQLVLQASAYARGGEVFMLDMGSPVNIRDLAARLVRLQGRRVGTDVEIRITGIRPGEKLVEELNAPEEVPQLTAHSSIVALRPVPLPTEALAKAVTSLSVLAENADDERVRGLLFDLAYGRIARHEDGLLKLRHRRRASDNGELREGWQPGVPRRRLSDFAGVTAAAPPPGATDAAVDAGLDAGIEAEIDAGIEAGMEAEEDAWTSSTT